MKRVRLTIDRMSGDSNVRYHHGFGDEDAVHWMKRSCVARLLLSKTVSELLTFIKMKDTAGSQDALS